MLNNISIYCGGVLTLLMALFHTRFYKFFGWRSVFKAIDPLNAKHLYTIHIALLLLFFLFGIISIVNNKELANSSGLALSINLFFALFWLWRFIWHFVYYRSKTRKARRPVVFHILTIWFALIFVSYAIPVFLTSALE